MEVKEEAKVSADVGLDCLNVGKLNKTTKIAFLYPSKAARYFFLAWENRISIAAISSCCVRPTFIFFLNSGDVVSISAIRLFDMSDDLRNILNCADTHVRNNPKIKH